MERDDFIIMIICYYHTELLYQILDDDARSNDYTLFDEMKKLCTEFKLSKIDDEDMDIVDTTRIFLEKKLDTIKKNSGFINQLSNATNADKVFDKLGYFYVEKKKHKIIYNNDVYSLTFYTNTQTIVKRRKDNNAPASLTKSEMTAILLKMEELS